MEEEMVVEMAAGGEAATEGVVRVAEVVVAARAAVEKEGATVAVMMGVEATARVMEAVEMAAVAMEVVMEGVVDIQAGKRTAQQT